MTQIEFRDRLLDTHLKDDAYIIVLRDFVKKTVRGDSDIGKDVESRAFAAIYSNTLTNKLRGWAPWLAILVSSIAIVAQFFGDKL